MSKINLRDNCRIYVPGDDYDPSLKTTRGEIEIIIRDRNKNVVQHIVTPNIVKIVAKEMLAHRLPSSELWDPEANGGAGGWVVSGIDVDEDFSARYILFGASFDENGLPLDVNDPRFYTIDPVTGSPVPIRLGPGAEYDGSLINAIPFSEPTRPLKRVEVIDFSPTYQPAGIPLLQSDVRAMNNIVRLSTTLQLDEYNGLGITDSDFFTITEVALAGGRKIDSVGTCECTPRQLFLQGTSDGSALNCIANCTDVVTIDSSETEIDLVKVGDQIKIVGPDDSVGDESVDQVSPYYLVLAKETGGRDIRLDRTPVDTSNNPIKGNIGIYKDTLRIFSHRLLSAPFKKSADFYIECRWSIIFS